MKKAMIFVSALLLLVPSVLFAAPSDAEVGATLSAVMTVYGMSMMAAMFGGDFPEGALEMDVSNNGMEVTLTYHNFPAREFLDGMGDMLADMSDGGAMTICPFNTMSGTIRADGDMQGGMKSGVNGALHLDLTLTGGRVQSLEMDMDESGEGQIKANGRRYTNMEQIFEAAGMESTK